jgi:hypothetical protein
MMFEESVWRRGLIEWIVSQSVPEHDAASRKMEMEQLFKKCFMDYYLTRGGNTTIVAVVDPITKSWNESWKIDGKSVRCASLYGVGASDTLRLGWASRSSISEYARRGGRGGVARTYVVLEDGSTRCLSEPLKLNVE